MELGGRVKGRMIIAMKGQPGTGKSTLARSMAEVFKCPVIANDDFESVTESPLDTILKVASTQLRLDLKVIIDSPLASRSHLNKLLELSTPKLLEPSTLELLEPSTPAKAPLVIIECKPQDSHEWNIRSNYGSSHSWPEYEDKDVAKIIVDTTSYVKVSDLCRAIEFLADSRGCDSVHFEHWEGDGFKSTGHSKKGNFQFHIHNFKLSDEDHDQKVNLLFCEGCLESIDGPYYKCEGCKLPIHIKCAESSPRHPQDEFLLAPSTEPSLHDFFLTEKFWCDDHQKDVFNCQTCLFETHLRSGSLPSILYHKCHNHPLRIKIHPRGLNYEFQCLACGELGQHALYNCSDCSFQCHINCALKPHTFKTVHHRHYLTFISSPPQDGDPDSICDICENERNPNYWTYRCPDPECDITSHLMCKNPYGS